MCSAVDDVEGSVDVSDEELAKVSTLASLDAAGENVVGLFDGDECPQDGEDARRVALPLPE